MSTITKRGPLKSSATKPVPTALEVLMRQVKAPERRELLDTMGVSESAWWQWCRRPGIIPGAHLTTLHAFLERKYERDFDLQDLYKTAA